MRPATSLGSTVVDVNTILHAGAIIEHPRDVIPMRASPLREARHLGVMGRPGRTVPSSMATGIAEPVTS